MTTKYPLTKFNITPTTSLDCTHIPSPPARRAIFVFIIFSVILSTWSPSVAIAQTTNDKPVLLVIETGQNDAARKRERAFISELQLALDRYRIVSEPAGDTASGATSFETSPLNQQMRRVRRLSRPHRAAAVIWLSENSTANLTLLHLAALSSGRALIRIVEAENGPNTEVTLAMAVDELVGQAYLFDAKNPTAAVEASVISAASNRLRTDLSDDIDSGAAQRNASDAKGPNRSFHINGIGRIGIVGNHGPRLTFGGSMGVRRLMPPNFFLGGGFNLIAGPFEDTAEQEIKNLSLAPHIDFGVMRRNGLIAMSAGVVVSIPWQQTIITLPRTGSHVYTDWNMRYAIQFMILIPLGKTLAIALSPEVGIWLNQKRYFAISSDRDIVRNPRVDLGLNIGFALTN